MSLPWLFQGFPLLRSIRHCPIISFFYLQPRHWYHTGLDLLYFSHNWQCWPILCWNLSSLTTWDNIVFQASSSISAHSMPVPFMDSSPLLSSYKQMFSSIPSIISLLTVHLLQWSHSGITSTVNADQGCNYISVLSPEFEAHVTSYLIILHSYLVSHSHLKSNTLKAKLITFPPPVPPYHYLVYFYLHESLTIHLVLQCRKTWESFPRLLWLPY